MCQAIVVVSVPNISNFTFLSTSTITTFYVSVVRARVQIEFCFICSHQFCHISVSFTQLASRVSQLALILMDRVSESHTGTDVLNRHTILETL